MKERKLFYISAEDFRLKLKLGRLRDTNLLAPPVPLKLNKPATNIAISFRIFLGQIF